MRRVFESLVRFSDSGLVTSVRYEIRDHNGDYESQTGYRSLFERHPSLLAGTHPGGIESGPGLIFLFVLVDYFIECLFLLFLFGYAGCAHA